MEIRNPQGRVYPIESTDKIRIFSYDSRDIVLIQRKYQDPLIPGYVSRDANVQGVKSAEVDPFFTREWDKVGKFLRKGLRKEEDPIAEMDFRFWINESEDSGKIAGV